MGYRCIQCGFNIKTLYLQYSPGNIRLMKCENCKAVADEYIECEITIIIIDLILHKPKAYRHLLYNVINQETLKFQGLLWKLAAIFLLFDACIHSYHLMEFYYFLMP
ncbi:Protein ARV 2, variant 3 [Lathyrus oleraceus]|uniref:Protein ARV n=1 Tax=Pisum sativum TaxID=3888 RepID=A0A9D4XTS6_PEA|nr:Protein ARV 2, variant 3 [Pisum sativum]